MKAFLKMYLVVMIGVAICFLFGWMACELYHVYTDEMSEQEFLRLNERRNYILDSLN